MVKASRLPPHGIDVLEQVTRARRVPLPQVVLRTAGSHRLGDSIEARQRAGRQRDWNGYAAPPNEDGSTRACDPRSAGRPLTSVRTPADAGFHLMSPRQSDGAAVVAAVIVEPVLDVEVAAVLDVVVGAAVAKQHRAVVVRVEEHFRHDRAHVHDRILEVVLIESRVRDVGGEGERPSSSRYEPPSANWRVMECARFACVLVMVNTSWLVSVFVWFVPGNDRGDVDVAVAEPRQADEEVELEVVLVVGWKPSR